MARISFLQAHSGDCIHIEDNGHNVIIDSGAVCEELVSVVNDIRESGEKIDLLIITHYDADHIKAICKILEELDKDVRKKLVSKVWFNATKVGYRDNHTLSANDATRLASLLLEADIEWTSCVKKGITEVLGPDSVIEVVDGGKIYTSEEKGIPLCNDRCDWESSFQELDEFINDRALDTSETNSQSMILVFRCGEKQILLPGDAVPKNLNYALEQYGSGKRIKFDLIKLPHHGSYKNMTQEILNKIECSEYFISTDGSQFHPNKKLMLKIKKWGHMNSKLTFHMNYYDDLFSKLNITEEDMNYYDFSCDGERTFEF